MTGFLLLLLLMSNNVHPAFVFICLSEYLRQLGAFNCTLYTFLLLLPRYVDKEILCDILTKLCSKLTEIACFCLN